jgi:hypothetical protein
MFLADWGLTPGAYRFALTSVSTEWGTLTALNVQATVGGRPAGRYEQHRQPPTASTSLTLTQTTDPDCADGCLVNGTLTWTQPAPAGAQAVPDTYLLVGRIGASGQYPWVIEVPANARSATFSFWGDPYLWTVYAVHRDQGPSARRSHRTDRPPPARICRHSLVDPDVAPASLRTLDKVPTPNPGRLRRVATDALPSHRATTGTRPGGSADRRADQPAHARMSDPMCRPAPAGSGEPDQHSKRDTHPTLDQVGAGRRCTTTAR